MVRTKGYPEALEKKLRDQRYYSEDSNPEFTKNVKGISRTIAHMCYLHRLMSVCPPQHLPHP
jgi:heterodisulfide reductase subunit C